MNDRQLSAVIVLAGHKSLNLSAEILTIDVPTLRRDLASLQEEIGINLFYTKGGQVILTDKGTELFPLFFSLNASFKAILRDAASSEDTKYYLHEKKKKFQLDYLETVLYLSQSLNMTETAENMFISQPAVTKRINAFEETIKCKLFDRKTGSKLSIVEGRENLIVLIKRAVDDYHNLEEHIKRQFVMSENTLRIGLVSHVGCYEENHFLAEFCLRHPEINVIWTYGSVKEIEESYDAGKFDAIIRKYDPENENHIKALEEQKDGQIFCIAKCRPYLLLNKEHPLANKETVNIKDLNNEMFAFLNYRKNDRLSSHFDRVCEENNVTYHIYEGETVMNKEMILTLVQFHKCVAISLGQTDAIYPNIVFKPLNPPFTIGLIIVKIKKDLNSKSIDQLKKYAKEIETENQQIS